MIYSLGLVLLSNMSKIMKDENVQNYNFARFFVL